MATPSRAAWYHTVSAIAALIELMDVELRRDCGMPLTWYDVLVEVYRSPDHTIRMNELADRTLLSRSWTTRRVRALEDAGLVQREGVSNDLRGVTARLTPAGLEAFKDMERSHSASIRRHFSDHLSADEVRLIDSRFEVLANHARDALGRRPNPEL